jgi:N-acetylglucosamine-6-phosphate deacetylase
MKRSADEALGSNESSMKNVDTSTPHRISIFASASSCSLAPSVPTESSAASLQRTVSSVSSNATETSSTKIMCRNKSKRHELGSPETRNGMTRLTNTRVLQKDGTLQLGSITLDPTSGLIVQMIAYNEGEGEEKKQEEALTGDGDNVVDCHGQIISPGFIDIQLNGAYGVDFSNAGVISNTNKALSVQDIFLVAQRLVETGVTSFCPTMVSSSPETYRRNIPLAREARKQQQRQQKLSNGMHKRGASILGMHLEGPFFASSKRGAHDDQHIDTPVKGIVSVNQVYGLSTDSNGHDEHELPRQQDIDIVTLAPELDGACAAILALTTPDNKTSHSVVVSCGHTEATYEDGIEALSSGSTLLTHLYNAMNPFHHRMPGLVGLLSSEAKLGEMGLKRPFYSMIVDGIHIHESAVSMAYRSHPHGEFCRFVNGKLATSSLLPLTVVHISLLRTKDVYLSLMQ